MGSQKLLGLIDCKFQQETEFNKFQMKILYLPPSSFLFCFRLEYLLFLTHSSFKIFLLL